MDKTFVEQLEKLSGNENFKDSFERAKLFYDIGGTKKLIADSILRNYQYKPYFKLFERRLLAKQKTEGLSDLENQQLEFIEKMKGERVGW